MINDQYLKHIFHADDFKNFLKKKTLTFFDILW